MHKQQGLSDWFVQNNVNPEQKSGQWKVKIIFHVSVNVWLFSQKELTWML